MSRVLNADELMAQAESNIRVWLKGESQVDRVDIEIQGVGLVQDILVWVTVGGTKNHGSIPYGVAEPTISDLRAAQVVPGRGAWTWCHLWMDVFDGVLHQECDWMREPDFGSVPAGAGEYAIELDIYPRDPEFVPDWLAERAAAYEKRKERNARRREARRRKREQERGG
ncbi:MULTISPECIES: hypothetical protein [unclassified Actinomyces]|uniref:hypothetical protein n=1 Tax=unclassified Actinomyces TaxID=2609248 RepID=UPI001F433903|nr:MULTISPECIES: hypothetical protein [unclassified Actinomyces]